MSRCHHSIYVVAVASWALAASCGSGDWVAEMAHKNNEVDSLRASTSQWQSAGLGDRYQIGDAVRTGRSSSADLTMTGGGGLHLDERTLIRFLASKRDRPGKLRVESGAAELESEGQAVVFDTVIGLARLRKRSRVRLSPTKRGTRLNVLIGTATLEDESGRITSLEKGQSLTVRVGEAVVEMSVQPDGEAPSAADQKSEASDDAGAASDDAGAASDDAGAASETLAGDESNQTGESAKTGELSSEPSAGSGVTARVSMTGGKIRPARGADGWQPLPVGDVELAEGSHVRLPEKATVELERGNQRATVVGDAEFLIGAAGGPLVEVSRGTVSIEATTENTHIDVPGGAIVARTRPSGSLGTIALDRRGRAIVTVERGKLQVRSAQGSELLVVGERASIDRTGKTVVKGRAPARADLAIPAGESPVVHEQTGQVALRIRFDHVCPAGGRVETFKSRRSVGKPVAISEGEGSALVWARRGRAFYRVRCLSNGAVGVAVAAQGWVQVRTDSGTRQLPQRATHNTLDADGRTYSVVYQHRLPRLTFRWSGLAAATRGWTLVVKKHRGSKRTFPVSGNQHTVKSGSVGEGRYSWWFQGPGGRRSPTTRLYIEFDSSASTAHITQPPTNAWQGGSVPIRGTALSGWRVEIGGKKVRRDRYNRFAAKVAIPTDEDAIAIRLSHRKHGIHYYLRRRPR